MRILLARIFEWVYRNKKPLLAASIRSQIERQKKVSFFIKEGDKMIEAVYKKHGVRKNINWEITPEIYAKKQIVIDEILAIMEQQTHKMLEAFCHSRQEIEHIIKREEDPKIKEMLKNSIKSLKHEEKKIWNEFVETKNHFLNERESVYFLSDSEIEAFGLFDDYQIQKYALKKRRKERKKEKVNKKRGKKSRKK